MKITLNQRCLVPLSIFCDCRREYVCRSDLNLSLYAYCCKYFFFSCYSISEKTNTRKKREIKTVLQLHYVCSVHCTIFSHLKQFIIFLLLYIEKFPETQEKTTLIWPQIINRIRKSYVFIQFNLIYSFDCFSFNSMKFIVSKLPKDKK